MKAKEKEKHGIQIKEFLRTKLKESVTWRYKKKTWGTKKEIICKYNAMNRKLWEDEWESYSKRLLCFSVFVNKPVGFCFRVIVASDITMN